ncbi:MAG TPA: sigma-70 family RNA polymerase sigma factor [Polyangiaceae bacterium]|nr:sigma-70 family RNA polymerase sigma factor [Polyangiaceae bacterium]
MSAAQSSDYEPAIRMACEAKAFDRATRLALEAYGKEILSFLYSRVRNPSNAQDAFSTFAEDIWTGFPGFGFRCSVRTWMYTVARNAAARIMASPEQRAARNLAISNVGEISELVARLRTETDAFQRTDVKDRFAALRDQLSSDDQMLLILRVDRGLSFRELALAINGDTELDDAAIVREAARLRKAFERVKVELRVLAEQAGLLRRD